MVFRNRQAVFLQGSDVAPDRFPNVLDRLFSRLALADTAGQTGAFDDPQTILPGIEHDLTHTYVVLIHSGGLPRMV